MTAGIASIIAGILVMIMPVLALASFVIVAAILMILVGISTLFLLSAGDRNEAPSVPVDEVNSADRAASATDAREIVVPPSTTPS